MLGSMQCISLYDPLTGTYTRQGLVDAVRGLCLPEHLPASVIAADIDALDSINELHGSEAGDNLLVAASGIMRALCGERAVIARTGSDQFIVVIPGTGHAAVAAIRERIDEAVSHLSVGAMNVSITMGTATLTDGSSDLCHAISESRAMMRRNKLNRGWGTHRYMLESLRRILTERTYETHAHSERMRQLAVKVGKALQLTRYDLDDLAILCELHDIGKIGIPIDILSKPGPLSEEEWAVMRTHPRIGYDIVSQIKYLDSVANGILTHHERWDGAGYPAGLRGQDIPTISRLLSIADAYDAMMHDRPYRLALGHEKAIAELRRGQGTQFDPSLVPVFIEIVEDTHRHASRRKST